MNFNRKILTAWLPGHTKHPEVNGTIAVDIDSTLFCFLSAFIEVAKEQFDITVPSKQDSWSGIEEPFESLEQFKECVIATCSADRLKKNPPFAGAIKALNKLHLAGYKIAYYTDRHRELELSTKKWLEFYVFPTPENLFMCEDKIVELAELGDLITIIDDKGAVLVWGVGKKKLPQVFGLIQHYNYCFVDVEGIVLEESWGTLYRRLLLYLDTLGIEEA